MQKGGLSQSFGAQSCGRPVSKERGAFLDRVFSVPVCVLCTPIPLGQQFLSFYAVYSGFPGGSGGKESTHNAGDLGLIPGLGSFPWLRAWQPTPVFLPSPVPMDRGGWWATVLGVAKGQTRLSDEAQYHTATYSLASYSQDNYYFLMLKFYLFIKEIL